MKFNVGVFFGGKSCEHEISCITASQVLKAIDRNTFNAIPVYISKNNEFYIGDQLEDINNYKDLNKLISNCQKVDLIKSNNKVLLVQSKRGIFNKKQIVLDVALIAAHGVGVEDGSLQGIFEFYDLPYTSSKVLPSAIGQDKVIQKIIWNHLNIPTVPGYSLDYYDFIRNYIDYKEKNLSLGYPLILKPSNLGSSIGIQIVNDESEFEEKVIEAAKYDYKILVEKFIKNFKELNCSVNGYSDEIEASVIEEVNKEEKEILDFDAKYLSGNKNSKIDNLKNSGMASVNRKIPAEIDEELSELIKKYSIDAYRFIDASGVVRIDYIYDLDSKKIYLNEMNNIPGSLAFYLWKENGIEFDKLITIMIENAIEAHRLKSLKTSTFETNILANYKERGGK